eukprot:12856492-Prorocentrum_lima.AAC.1
MVGKSFCPSLQVHGIGMLVLWPPTLHQFEVLGHPVASCAGYFPALWVICHGRGSGLPTWDTPL